MNARNVEPPIARYTTSCLRRIRASPIPEARPAQGGRGPRHAGPGPTRRSGGAADDTQAAQEARPTPEPKVRGLSASKGDSAAEGKGFRISGRSTTEFGTKRFENRRLPCRAAKHAWSR